MKLREHLLPRALFAIIVVYALIARIMMSHQGLPYLNDYDEPFIVNFTMDVLKNGELNPGRFHYGTAIIYMTALGGSLNLLRLQALPESSPYHVQSMDDVQTGIDGTAWSISHPSFYLWSRGTVALLGTGWVILCWLIARSLAGEWAGTSAAFLMAIAVKQTELSGITRTDVPMGFFAVAMVACCVFFERHGKFRYLAWAAVMGGFATAYKFNGAVFAGIPFLVLLRAHFTGTFTAEKRHWGMVLSLPLAAFALLTPYSILDWPTFSHDIFKELDHYAVMGHGSSTSERGIPHMIHQAGNYWRNWGLHFLLAFGGVALMVRSRQGSVVVGGLGLYLFFMSMMRVNFHRNFVHGDALIAIASALALVWALGQIRERAPKHAVPAMVAVTLVWLGAAAGRAVGTTSMSWSAYASEDTRSASIAVLNDLAAENGWERIGIDGLLRYHPWDLQRLTVPFKKDSIPNLMRDAQEYDALVCSSNYLLVFKQELRPVMNQTREILRNDFETITLIPGKPLYVDISTDNPQIRVIKPPRP